MLVDGRWAPGWKVHANHEDPILKINFCINSTLPSLFLSTLIVWSKILTNQNALKTVWRKCTLKISLQGPIL